jgi:hypothetical protein
MLDAIKNKVPVPYLRNVNVRWGSFDLSDILEMRMTADERETFSIKDGDVLICDGGEPGRAAVWRSWPTNLKCQKALHRARAYDGISPDLLAFFLKYISASGEIERRGSGSAKEVGKPAIWRDEIADCCFQNTLLRVRPTACSSEFLYHYFLFCALTERFVSSTQGINIYHIGKDGLARFPLPLPPTQEQDEIVRRVDTAFSWIDRLGAETTSARKLIDRLDQAVLAKAFRGELVPQDPNDEPARVLLERNRASRQAAPGRSARKRGAKASA